MGTASFNTDRVPTCDDIVSALLSGHPLGQPVSTLSLLTDFRATSPTSIVRIATGRTMAVVFDHRAASDPSSISWPRTDATV
jgi:hypothetical protein